MRHHLGLHWSPFLLCEWLQLRFVVVSLVGFVKVFGAWVGGRECDLHAANVAAVVVHFGPGVGDLSPTSGVDHGTFAAMVTDVVDAADANEGMGFTHGMRFQRIQKMATRMAVITNWIAMSLMVWRSGNFTGSV